MRELGELENAIYDDGHRLIPGVTHDEAERIRHVARYEFCKQIIHEDISALNRLAPTGGPVRVLDLGCGVGYGSAILASIPGVSVLGIDVSKESILYAQTHYDRPNVEYRVQDVVEFVSAMKQGDWDYVVSNEVVEHIRNGFALIERLKFHRLAVISTPYNEPQGVNPHHLVWNITEQSYQDLGCKEFFFTDLRGSIYDNRHKPQKAINLIAVLYDPKARGVVRKIRRRVWFRHTMDQIRGFPLESRKQLKLFVRVVVGHVRKVFKSLFPANLALN